MENQQTAQARYELKTLWTDEAQGFVTLAGVPAEFRRIQGPDKPYTMVLAYTTVSPPTPYRISPLNRIPEGITLMHDILVYSHRFRVYVAEEKIARIISGVPIAGPFGCPCILENETGAYALVRDFREPKIQPSNKTRPIQISAHLYDRLRALANSQKTTLVNVANLLLSEGFQKTDA